jgi:hypothetical protein
VDIHREKPLRTPHASFSREKRADLRRQGRSVGHDSGGDGGFTFLGSSGDALALRFGRSGSSFGR